MDRTVFKALYVILLSLGLAFVFNFLFFGKLVGVSVLLFTVMLVGTVFLFGLREQVSLRKSWWLMGLIGFFALMPAVRASEFLTFLNICSTFGLLMLLAHQLVGTPTFVMKLRDYVVLFVVVPFQMLTQALSAISLVSQVHSTIQQRDVWVRIVKGVVMSVPILIIFGLLFSQADLAFSKFIKSFVDISISERTAQYTALLLFAFATTLGFLSYIFFVKQAESVAVSEQSDAEVQSGRGVEVLVFLGLIATLFAVFIGFQITYLFGGETNIINAGFTYAEYARRGFWELLAVSLLSLLILLVAEKYASNESSRDKRFLIPALILVAEVVIVMVSAFKRLSLYIDAYGMTLQRFYVAGFIMLLLVLFMLLAVKFILSKREQFFAFSALLSVAGFLIIVNIVNPDVFVAQANLERYNRTGKVDVLYIQDLSADAASQNIALYQKLEGEDKARLQEYLYTQRDRLQQESSHWQSTNVSRSRALRLLEKLEE